MEQDASPGQVYLRCTDGLTDMPPDATMEQTITETFPDGLDAHIRALVAAANEQGWLGNITVVLVSLEEE
jgi:serine/threonine protein phosphatase PrpC